MNKHATAMMLALLLTAGAARGQAPDWSVDPARYQSSMSLTGVVVFQGMPLAAPGTLLAAFAGEEVRGMAEPLTVGTQALFFLTVYADTDGETITFRVYDAAADVVRDVAETEVFETNAVRGLVSAPLTWTALDAASGAPAWTVDPAAFARSMSVTGTYTLDGRPAGADDRVAAFAGEEVRGVAEPVFVNGVYLFFLTVYADAGGEALTFKVYDAVTGQVFPARDTLTFATNAVVGSVAAPFVWTLDTATTGPPAWAVDPAAFALSMSVTGTYTVDGRLPGPDDRVAAFAGGVVRGVAGPTDVGGTPVFFLTVYADAGGEALTFKVYDAATEHVFPVVEGMNFAANAVVGTAAAPFVWTLDTAAVTAVEALDGPAAFRLAPAYPNPFNPVTRIPYAVPAAGPVRLTVHDALGREVARLVDRRQAPGAYAVPFDAAGLPSGLYLVRLQAAGRVATRAVTLLK